LSHNICYPNSAKASKVIVQGLIDRYVYTEFIMHLFLQLKLGPQVSNYISIPGNGWFKVAVRM
jgi:hypothetical protein